MVVFSLRSPLPESSNVRETRKFVMIAMILSSRTKRCLVSKLKVTLGGAALASNCNQEGLGLNDFHGEEVGTMVEPNPSLRMPATSYTSTNRFNN